MLLLLLAITVTAQLEKTIVASAWCPLAVTPDYVIVACPGWEPRPCRERDKNNDLRRSSSAKREFLQRYGFPKGRKGWVLDHLCALAKGGCDVPWNLQFQTTADAKAKDRWEQEMCGQPNLPDAPAEVELPLRDAQ